jgi:hypothetical protein
VNKYIVITTINEPTEAIVKFSKKRDWKLIIVGDLKTPHNKYKNIDCIYLSPEIQEKKYKKISNIIGWNTSLRRNIGFIEAYKLGADILALSDDDNIPYRDWGKNLSIGKEITATYYKSKNKVFDPLSVTNHPYLWHRGYPIQYISNRETFYSGMIKIKPLIQVDLWNGNPDVDAIERMIYKTEKINFENFENFCCDTISPFDSQNTFLAREMIPYFMLIPEVGRVDDIIGSYLLQMKYKSHLPYIVYCKPSVFQKRNQHNLIDDLSKEIWGYNNIKDFVEKKFRYDWIENFYHQYQQYFK